MELERPKSGRYRSRAYCSGCSRCFFVLITVPFWCSIRVAVAFVGFLGMVAHYSQKISVGIALVCMVNHSAIEPQHSSLAMAVTQADLDCPMLNNTAKIVKQSILLHSLFVRRCLSYVFTGRFTGMVKECSRYCARRLLLGLFDYGSSGWLSGGTLWRSIYLRRCDDYCRCLLYSDAVGCQFTLGSVLAITISRGPGAWSDMAVHGCDHVALGPAGRTRQTGWFYERR